MLLFSIVDRGENTQTGIQLCFNLVFTTFSQKSHLNWILVCFYLISVVWISPCLSLPLGLSKNLRGWFLNLLRLSPNFLCFHHEWGLHPSYATDNGGNIGGNIGGDVVENIAENVVENIVDVPSYVPSYVPSLSQVLSQVLSQDEEKDASIDAKDATSSSKVATLDEKAASLADNRRNSAIRKQRQELYKEPHW